MKRLTLATALAVGFALPALACDGLHIEDAYARASTGMSQSGAAFMHIANHGDTECRLIGARSDAAERVELHTHLEDDSGIMRMLEVEEGFVIPANGEHILARGGDHLMFLGLTRAFNHGDDLVVTLSFEQGDDIEITIPVDLERTPDHHGGHSHGHAHGHSHN